MEMIAFGAYDTNLFIRVKATGGRCEDICAILRGLFYSSGHSDGQGKKNSELRTGCVVRFGAQPMMVKFVESVEANLNKQTLALIEMRSADRS
jgi:hypothetical protein